MWPQEKDDEDAEEKQEDEMWRKKRKKLCLMEKQKRIEINGREWERISKLWVNFIRIYKICDTFYSLERRRREKGRKRELFIKRGGQTS